MNKYCISYKGVIKMWKKRDWQLLNGHLWITLNGKNSLNNYYGLGFSISTMGIGIELIFLQVDIWWQSDN